ncbi:MAG: hypothetical protein ACJ76H_02785 [Bacteriovoracaceae bacterium]
MESWNEFFILVGTGAATLVGLMFIALTFGSRLVTKETVDAAKAFLTPIINHFTQTFLISCAALIPSPTSVLPGVVCLLTSSVRLVLLRHAYKNLKRPVHSEDIDQSDWLQTLYLPLIIHISLVITSIGLMNSLPWSMYALAVILLSLLTLGIINAWEMLMWMASKLE